MTSHPPESADGRVVQSDNLPPNWLADIIESSRADLATIPVTSRPTWIRHLLLEPVDSTSADATYNPDVWELQRRCNVAADALAAAQARIAELERWQAEQWERRPPTKDEIHERELETAMPQDYTRDPPTPTPAEMLAAFTADRDVKRLVVNYPDFGMTLERGNR